MAREGNPRKGAVVKRFASVSLALLCCGLLVPVAHGAEPRFCFGEQATITDGAASSTIVGTSGRDVIEAGSGSDTIYGKGGNDLICGSFGGDLVYGGRGNDKLTGGRNTWDVVDGGPGNDYMEGDHSCCADLTGGDTVSYRNATGPVTVDLPANTATGQGTDTVVGFGQIDGSAFGDRLVAEYAWSAAAIRGMAGDDLIIGYDGPEDREEIFLGGKGNDTIRGRDGIEFMVGGPGNDTLRGGLSNNPWGEFVGDQALYGGGFLLTNSWIWEGNGGGAVTVDLAAGTASGEQGQDTLGGIETIIGSVEDDTLLGDENDNILSGGDGTDTIDGRGGTDGCDGEIVQNCE